MEETKDIIIELKDGSKTIIHNAKDYYLRYEDKVVVIEKNGSNIFVNFNEIVYMGWASNLIANYNEEKHGR